MRILNLVLLFQILGLHIGNQFLGEVVEFDCLDAQVMHQPVVTEHRGDGDQQTGHGVMSAAATPGAMVARSARPFKAT